MQPTNFETFTRLQYKADVNVVNAYNRLPVYEAAAMGCVDGLKELILSRGVDQVTKDLRTPLESAQKCRNGYEQDCLFDAIPLHFAAKEGKMGAVEFLLLIRAAYYLTDSTGRVPQDYADKSVTKDIYNFIIASTSILTHLTHPNKTEAPKRLPCVSKF